MGNSKGQRFLPEGYPGYSLILTNYLYSISVLSLLWDAGMGWKCVWLLIWDGVLSMFFSLFTKWCQTNKQQHKKSGHELLIFVYLFYNSCSTSVMQCGQLSHNIGINTNTISALASVACFRCHFIILMVKLIFIWYRYKIQLRVIVLRMRYKQMTTKKIWEYFIDPCLHILNSCSIMLSSVDNYHHQC
jgi:hypothetical protein